MNACAPDEAFAAEAALPLWADLGPGFSGFAFVESEGDVGGVP